MRNVVLGFGMSLDGYIAQLDGGVDFLTMDKESEKLMKDFFSTIDAIVMGRKTMEGSMRMTGGKYQPPAHMATYVFSRTWEAGKRDGFEVVKESPAGLIRKLKKRAGKNIFLTGGGELGRSFLDADLVDELFLGIYPILLGAGVPAFPPKFPQRDFKLIECKGYSGGSVGLLYKRIFTNASGPGPLEKPDDYSIGFVLPSS